MNERPPIVVFCERIDNEHICESVVRELGAYYDVRACGPGWPARDLRDVDARGARFYLELDSVSGNFDRPTGLAELRVPKFAWLVDTHKKPAFHRQVAKEMDLTFYAHPCWGQVFDTPSLWLPLHCDAEYFKPTESERELDVVFVGSQTWRADPVIRIAERHGLKAHVVTTTGVREKSETAAIYAKTKLVFNRHAANDLNFRVFEAMACGRVLLTDAQWNGQYELFEDEKHYVLYKDEKDLEAKLLHYVRDDEARARIEHAAAELAHARHTTRARVRQLREAIEERLARISVAASAPAQVALIDEEAPRRRWLFFVGVEPVSIDQRTYGERLAWALAARGDDVVIAREKRCVLPRREPRAGEPRIVDLEAGPLPRATEARRELEVSGPLHRAFDHVAREHGPFDVIVGEGALGGLTAAPVAARLGRPFLLALDGCEVARRGNRLTREQLAVAELEHWGAERARAVLAPDAGVADPVAEFYRSSTIVAAVAEPIAEQKEGDERFLAALGFTSGGYDLSTVSVSATGAPLRVLLAHARGADARVKKPSADSLEFQSQLEGLLAATPPKERAPAVL